MYSDCTYAPDFPLKLAPLAAMLWTLAGSVGVPTFPETFSRGSPSGSEARESSRSSRRNVSGSEWRLREAFGVFKARTRSKTCVFLDSGGSRNFKRQKLTLDGLVDPENSFDIL